MVVLASDQLYWLTVPQYDQKCDACRHWIVKDSDVIYRASPRRVLCIPCADDFHIISKPSRKWLERDRQQRIAEENSGVVSLAARVLRLEKAQMDQRKHGDAA